MSMFHNRLNSLKHVQYFIAHTSNKKKEKEKKRKEKIFSLQIYRTPAIFWKNFKN